MKLPGQPVGQARLGPIQIDIADTGLLKSEFLAPGPDRSG
jgi:hypothetical protein